MPSFYTPRKTPHFIIACMLHLVYTLSVLPQKGSVFPIWSYDCSWNTSFIMHHCHYSVILLKWLSGPFMPLKYSHDSRPTHKELEKVIPRATPWLISLAHTIIRHISPNAVWVKWKCVFRRDRAPALTWYHGALPPLAMLLTTHLCIMGRCKRWPIPPQKSETKLILDAGWRGAELRELNYPSLQNNMLQNYFSTPEGSSSYFKKYKIIKEGPLAHLPDKLLTAPPAPCMFKNRWFNGWISWIFHVSSMSSYPQGQRCRDK